MELIFLKSNKNAKFYEQSHYLHCLFTFFFITRVSQNVYGRQMKTGKRDLIKVGEKKRERHGMLEPEKKAYLT